MSTEIDLELLEQEHKELFKRLVIDKLKVVSDLELKHYVIVEGITEKIFKIEMIKEILLSPPIVVNYIFSDPKIHLGDKDSFASSGFGLKPDEFLLFLAGYTSIADYILESTSSISEMIKNKKASICIKKIKNKTFNYENMGI